MISSAKSATTGEAFSKMQFFEGAKVSAWSVLGKIKEFALFTLSSPARSAAV
jgi:hypothetical protein